MNAWQRLHVLSQRADLTILSQRWASFQGCVSAGTPIVRPSLPGKLGVILASIPLLRGRRGAGRWDVVVTEPSVLGLCGYLGKRWAGIQWVVDVWDIPIRCAAGRTLARIRCGVTRRLLRHLYRFADLFIVSILPDVELKWFKIPPERMACFTNAVWAARPAAEPTRALPAPPRRILCMRTTYSPDMGLDTLCKAFTLLDHSIGPLNLTIVGRVAADVRNQLQPLGGRTDVEYHEAVAHDLLMRMIAESAVCVVPFRDVPDLAQTYPIKVLEYLQAGRIVVAADLPGIRRMVRHGDNGLLFRPGDARDLARLLTIALTDRELQRRLEERAPQLDRQFDAEHKNAQILARIEELVQP